jgi:HD-like signal output (HDOD) protein
MGDRKSLLDRITQHLAEKEITLPVLDRMAGVIRDLASRDDVPIAKIAAAVEKDPVLAARILNLSNSSAYAGLVKMKSVERAIARVGLKLVKEFLMTGLLKDVFVAHNPLLKDYFRRWWKSSLGTAVCMKRLAEHIGQTGMGEDAYVLGLVHDIGVVAILKVLNDFAAAPQPDMDLQPDLIEEVMASCHTSVSANVLRKLEFEDRMIRLVETHATPDAYEDQDDVFLHLLQVAIHIVRKTSLAMHPDFGISVVNLPSAIKLRVDPVFIALVEVDLEDSCETLEKLLQ